MSNQELVPRKNMTDEERLELAARLDADLEGFIDGLEKKRYEDGWPEDRWEEVCKYLMILQNMKLKISSPSRRKWTSIRSS